MSNESSPRRHRIISIVFRGVVSFTLIALALGVYVWLASTREVPPPAPDADERPTVRVMRPVPVPVRRQWEGFGTVRPLNSADVAAEVGGVVVDVPADVLPGRPVEAGDVLARIDPAEYLQRRAATQRRLAEIDALLTQLTIEARSLDEQVELAAAETAYAENELERLRTLLEQGAAEEFEVEQAEAALRAARRTEVALRERLELVPPRREQLLAQQEALRAELRLAELDVERTTVRSPIAGVLELVDVEPGERVGIGARVARVVQLDPVEVPLRLPAAARPTIGVGDEVTLVATGGVPVAWVGEIARVAPVDEEETRTMTAYVVVDARADEPPLPPGKFVRGVVESSVPEPRVVVPRRAVVNDVLLLERDGVLEGERVAIDFYVRGVFPETGLDAPEDWAVLESAPPPGANLVLDRGTALRPGAAVDPVLINPDAARAMTRDGAALGPGDSGRNESGRNESGDDESGGAGSGGAEGGPR